MDKTNSTVLYFKIPEKHKIERRKMCKYKTVELADAGSNT
jgi:hypothetical protein